MKTMRRLLLAGALLPCALGGCGGEANPGAIPDHADPTVVHQRVENPAGLKPARGQPAPSSDPKDFK